MTARIAIDGQIVVEIGEHESAADLARRRPDLFRCTGDGTLYIGPAARQLTILRAVDPEPFQMPGQYSPGWMRRTRWSRAAWRGRAAAARDEVGVCAGPQPPHLAA